MKKMTLIIVLILSLFNCKKKDPCDAIACQHNGTCIDGHCDCPEGYTGGLCELQETPDKVAVNQITVTKFRATDPNGDSWDVLNGADLKVVLLKNGVVIWESPDYYEDANPNLSYTFILPADIFLDDPTEQYEVDAFDFDDLDADDYIGGFTFTPYPNSTNDFPQFIILEEDGYPTAFILSVDYQF